MKTRILTPLAAVLAMLATACQDPPPEPATVTEPEPAEPELAAYLDVDFMGTREERERRAPYSPIWWPHEVGEVVSHQHWWQLYHTNPWNGIGSVFWLDTLAFEPVFSTVWPEGEPVPTGPMKVTSPERPFSPRMNGGMTGPSTLRARIARMWNGGCMTRNSRKASVAQQTMKRRCGPVSGGWTGGRDRGREATNDAPLSQFVS